MSREIDKYKERNYTGRNARLLEEWSKIDKAFSNNKQVEYGVCRTNEVNLPIAYDIYFTIKSIIGVEQPDEQGLKKPIFGWKHELRITLPNNYPAKDGPPEFKFLTDVWHPNVTFFGDEKIKGRTCLTTEVYGAHVPLVDYIYRVIDYLKYELYNASDNRGNHRPQDTEVAEWVLSQGEPQGWLIFKQD